MSKLLDGVSRANPVPPLTACTTSSTRLNRGLGMSTNVETVYRLPHRMNRTAVLPYRRCHGQPCFFPSRAKRVLRPGLNRYGLALRQRLDPLHFISPLDCGATPHSRESPELGFETASWPLLHGHSVSSVNHQG